MLRVIQAQDKEQVLLFATNNFHQHEPMTRATGKALSEMIELFGPVTEACCSSGMSFMLEHQQPDTDTNTIISVSLTLPYPDYKAVQWPDVPRPARDLMTPLAELPTDQHAAAVYMFLWATHTDHMGKGHVKAVVSASEQAAQQAGFRFLVADVTNVVSQHLAIDRFGYMPMEPKARYHDHERFKTVTCSEFVIRAVKDLARQPEGEATLHTQPEQQQQQQQEGGSS
jgi:hypothetical protein